MGDTQHTVPDSKTRRAEAGAARAEHRADRPADPEEARLADRQEADPEVSRAFQEANQRGASQKGEGRVP